MRKRIRAIIHGSVQGVGFRWFAVRCANKNRIVGWVRNNYDGSVETVAEGESDDLEKFVVELRSGPSAGYVSSIETEELSPKNDFDRFEIVF